MKRYIVELAHQTRNHKDVYLGVSPRGSIALMKAAQAYAFAYGREYVIPDDIQIPNTSCFCSSHHFEIRAQICWRFSGGNCGSY